MPKTAEEIRKRLEQLRYECKRLYEQHRKLVQKSEELRVELKKMEQRPKAS
jgi:chaperonin cofactor prefoldin